MLRRLTVLKMPTLLMIAVLSLGSCAGISADCAWVKKIILSDTSIEALKTPEIKALLDHNDKVEEFCR